MPLSWTVEAPAKREEILSGLDLLNALPLWVLALIVIGVSVFFSVGLQLLTRWHFGVDLLSGNHEVAGFKYAVVGVAYAVLLAFVVVSVWNEFERTQRSVEAEAERFYNFYRTSYNFPESTGKPMREALIAYAIEVRDQDWPEMKSGRRGSASAAEAYARLSFMVGQTKPGDISLLPSAAHAIDLLQQTADFRLERLSDVGGHVTPVIWWVLVLSGIITLAYPAFFAAKSVGAQILMTGGLAAIIGATLFLTIVLNYPFSGPAGVTAQPIDDVIRRMQAQKGATLE